MASGWGDVLHYPEFLRNMEGIGTYQDKVYNKLRQEGNLNNEMVQMSISESILEIKRALEDVGKLFKTRRGRRLN